MAAAWQAVGVVEGDECAEVAAVVGVFKAPGQAFFVQQAHDEVEVGFAVLQAVAAGGQRCGEGEAGAVVGGHDGVGRGVFVENLADDGVDAQVLEHAAGAAVLQQGEGRFDLEGVAGKAAVGAEGAGAGDDAAAQQGAAVLLLQGEGGGEADEGGERDGVVGGEALQLVVVGLGEGFASGEGKGEQAELLLQVIAQLQGKLACVLGEGAGKAG